MDDPGATIEAGAGGAASLVEGVRARHVPSLARALSLVENRRPGFESLLSSLHADVGRAQRIGITGPPGAGKSTLTEGLIRAYRSRDVSVAVVAVDPTSPFTGGALLGDRVRMESVALDPGVFIRSMATRGATGGLATTTREVCDVLDAFGFDRVVVETVGIGQSELAIAGTADTAVLVLVPESGDEVQVLKAGVMEIADIYVVNKADRPGGHRLAREIEEMLAIQRSTRPTEGTDAPWTPPVLVTTATTGEGLEALVEHLDGRSRFLEDTGVLARQRRDRLARHTREVVDRALQIASWADGRAAALLEREIDRVAAGEISSYQLAERILSLVRGGA